MVVVDVYIINKELWVTQIGTEDKKYEERKKKLLFSKL